MEASWWERLAAGETGFCSDGRAMLSKSLIQFSVDGWGCVPSLLFTWSQTMEEVMKIMVISFIGPMHALLHLMPPTLQLATGNPRLHQKLLDTRRQVLVSLLWGHCSFFLDSAHKVLSLPSKNQFPYLCKFWRLYGGLMATSYKRAYPIPISAAPRAPPPAQSTADPYLHSRHSNTVLSQSLLIIIL